MLSGYSLNYDHPGLSNARFSMLQSVLQILRQPDGVIKADLHFGAIGQVNNCRLIYSPGLRLELIR